MARREGSNLLALFSKLASRAVLALESQTSERIVCVHAGLLDVELRCLRHRRDPLFLSAGHSSLAYVRGKGQCDLNFVRTELC